MVLKQWHNIYVSLNKDKYSILILDEICIIEIDLHIQYLFVF